MYEKSTTIFNGIGRLSHARNAHMVTPKSLVTHRGARLPRLQTNVHAAKVATNKFWNRGNGQPPRFLSCDLCVSRRTAFPPGSYKLPFSNRNNLNNQGYSGYLGYLPYSCGESRNHDATALPAEPRSLERNIVHTRFTFNFPVRAPEFLFKIGAAVLKGWKEPVAFSTVTASTHLV